jgi:hypothetical protein
MTTKEKLFTYKIIHCLVPLIEAVSIPPAVRTVSLYRIFQICLYVLLAYLPTSNVQKYYFTALLLFLNLSNVQNIHHHKQSQCAVDNIAHQRGILFCNFVVKLSQNKFQFFVSESAVSFRITHK